MSKLTVEQIKEMLQIKVANGEVRINCPFCDDDKQHMYINFQKGVFKCFKCNESGRITKEYRSDVVDYGYASKKFVNQDKQESGRKPEPLHTLPLNFPIQKPVTSKSTFVYEENYKRNERAALYLFKRGLNWKDIEKYDVRVSRENVGPYVDTIIFPIWRSGADVNEEDSIDYFVARRITNKQPKYINAPWKKKDTLFIADSIPYVNKPSVIVEGIFDAIGIYKVGFRGVSLLGKTASSQQLNRLRKVDNGKGYLIMLDEDALTQAIKLKLQLTALDIKATIMKGDSLGRDASQLSIEEFHFLKDMLEYETTRHNEWKPQM